MKDRNAHKPAIKPEPEHPDSVSAAKGTPVSYTAGAPHAITFPRDPRHDAPSKKPHARHSRPKPNRLSVKIGGEAGFGIGVSGLLLTKTFSRGGLSALDYTEYPSLIRGGHNTFLLRVDDRKVHAPLGEINVLVALNKHSVFLHEHELSDDGAILYDIDEVDLDPAKDLKRGGLGLFGIPMESLAVEHGGDKLMRNVVALGALLGMTGYPIDILNEVIEAVFSGKGKKGVVEKNIAAAKAGHDFVAERFTSEFPYRLKAVDRDKDQIALTGSEAVALGAIAAGCKIYSAYPMTPATPVMHYLAAKQHEVGMVVRHAEDEIAAINLAIGASFAGVRAMTGSAGGGFALMVEALGLAAITETPLVILEAQRPGPATGLPTWTDQSDLRFLIHASQGEFPRIILAAGDVDECFSLTFDAFNLADKYQLPVFVMTDKYLSESHFTTKPFRTEGLRIDRGKMVADSELKAMKRRFKRYEVTKDGVSPRSIPGQEGGIFMANSDEHDEFGYSSEDAKNRLAQTEKRYAKLDSASRELPPTKLHGSPDAELTIIGWGSTKGSILEGLNHLRQEGVRANFLQLTTVWPFPEKAVTAVLEKAERTLLVENNRNGQLGGLIREHVGTKIENRLLKYDGRPIYPEEVYHKAMEVARG